MEIPGKELRENPRYRWYILTVVLLGAFMSALDLNLMNIVNPVLREVYRQPLYIIEWATLAYQLTLTVLLPILGRISDVYGRKKFYNTGFVIFIIGSGMVGMGLSIQWIIFWRIIQAIGATFLQSNSIAIITANFPSNERGKAIGIQGAVQGIGMAIGPSFGGFLIQYLSWNYAFYINVPVGIIGTILAYYILPETKSERGYVKIDYLSAALFATFFSLFLFNFSMSSSKLWSNEYLYGLYAISLIFFFIFVYEGKRSSEPIIDFSLLKNRFYVAANFSGMISYLIIGGTMFVFPFYLEYVLKYSPALAGSLLIIIPAFMSVGTPISGTLSDRIGYRLPTFIGFLLISLGTLMVVIFSNATTNIYEIIIFLLIIGLGMGIFTAPNNSSIMGISPSGKLSLVGGFLNMMRSLGLIFGVSLTTFVYELNMEGKLYNLPPVVLESFRNSMTMLFVFSVIGLILTLVKGKAKVEKVTHLPVSME